MPMTFKQWRATRRWCDDLQAEDCHFAGPGYIYGNGDYVGVDTFGGFGGFVVPIGVTEARFDDFDEAERYLWDEWSKDEIGEAA